MRNNVQSIRRVLFLSQKGLCARCKKKIYLEDKDPSTKFQIDHINPKFKGGKNNMKNLQALCIPCHLKKTEEERFERGFYQKLHTGIRIYTKDLFKLKKLKTKPNEAYDDIIHRIIKQHKKSKGCKK